MKKILVVDDMPIFREPIAASVRREGYKTFSAANGKEALELIRQEPPDLVLLDVGMPVMDGLELLKVLRADPQTRSIPVIMLTAMAEREPVSEALKVGVQGYLLKSRFSLADMLSKIAKVLGESEKAEKVEQPPKVQSASKPPAPTRPAPASSTLRAAAPSGPALPKPAVPDRPEPAPANRTPTLPSMNKATTLAHVHKKLELQAVPPVLRTVMAMVNSTRTSIDEIAGSVRQDPALAIRVLKIANSSLFGSGRQIQSLSEATQRIGIAGIRNTVAAILAIEHFSTATIGGINPQRFWEHSVATAVLSQLLGQTMRLADTEHLFLAGLLHDIGRLILCNALPKEYEAVLAFAAAEGCDLMTAEKKAFGLSHVDVTREALAKLDTSEMVLDAARLHEFETPQIERASSQSQDAMIVALANRLAHAVLLGDSGNPRLLAVQEHAAALSLSGETLHAVARSAAEKTSETSMFYASQSNDKLCSSLPEVLGAKVEQPAKVTVFAHEAPGDPVSLFFEQMGWLDLAEPEIGVLYVTKDVKPKKAWRDLQSLEMEIGHPLGVLTVSPGGSVAPPADEIAERPSATGKVPGPYEDLIQAVSRLQSEVAAPASA